MLVYVKSFKNEEAALDRPRVRRASSGAVRVPFLIVADSLEPPPQNRIFNLYGRPQSGSVRLTLRDPDGTDDTVITITSVSSLQGNHLSGSILFRGILEGGGTIAGHFFPGPATTEVIGKAVITP